MLGTAPILLVLSGERATNCANVDDTQQHPGATPTHNFFLRTDHAGYDIDGGGQCFCNVAEAATSPA